MSETAAEYRTSLNSFAETATYSAPSEKSSVAVEFVAGERPSLADETITLLRGRLRALCWVMLLGLSLFLLRTLVLRDAPLVWLRVGTLAVASGLILYLHHPNSHSLKQMRVVELIGLGALGLQSVALQVAGMTAAAKAGDPQANLSNMLVAFTVWGIIIMSYGFFIPNTPRRSLVMVVPAMLAPLMTTVVLCRVNPEVAAITDWNAVVTGTLTTCIAGLAAVYGTYTVAALRKESFAARKLGQYQLRQRLGGGGMGEVFLAEHALLKRPCAIKLIRPAYEADAVAIARFEREVHATAKLTHWNTIDIFDYGRTQDGTFYYVMEYLPGMSLQEMVLRHGPLPPARVVYLLRQTCQALAEAHVVGLVHRDIKPGNLFVAERGGQFDVAKLLDFGLVAELSSGDGKKEHDPHQPPGSVSGTPLYMSPEQSQFEHTIDGRSDIYSLGATAYFMLTGTPPFTASELHELLDAHQTAQLVPPQQVDPTLPEDLCDIVVRCLAKDPHDRFANVDELEQLLGDCSCADDWGPRAAARWWDELTQLIETQPNGSEQIPLKRPSEGVPALRQR
ncbi:MAG: serine/threonine-protein kinase [Aeoliella sp.]